MKIFGGLLLSVAMVTGAVGARAHAAAAVVVSKSGNRVTITGTAGADNVELLSVTGYDCATSVCVEVSGPTVAAGSGCMYDAVTDTATCSMQPIPTVIANLGDGSDNLDQNSFG